MNRYTRMIGIAFVLATFAVGFLFSWTAENYAMVTESQVLIQAYNGNVRIIDVKIPKISDSSEEVVVSVVVQVHNPGRLPIWVYDIEYSFYNFNKSELERIEEPIISAARFVSTGGFLDLNHPYLVGAGKNRILSANMTVRPGTQAMKRLDVTDEYGKYYPFVKGDLRYVLKEFDIKVHVYGLWYLNPQGVDPCEP